MMSELLGVVLPCWVSWVIRASFSWGQKDTWQELFAKASMEVLLQFKTSVATHILAPQPEVNVEGPARPWGLLALHNP